MSRIITNKHISEIYTELISSWHNIKNDRLDLKIIRLENGNITWAIKDSFFIDKEVVYVHKDVLSLFYEAVMKEIYGRKDYTKKKIIDSIKREINLNYAESCRKETYDYGVNLMKLEKRVFS